MDQPYPAGQRQPEQGHRGKRFESVADGAGEDRVFLDPFQIALVERPLPGLAERLDSHALPDRGQPENRFQAVRLANLPHVVRGRRQLPVGPAHADGLGDRGVGSQLQQVHGPLVDPGMEIVDRSQVGRGVEGKQAQLEQGEDGGPRLDAEGRQGMAQPRERPDRRLGQREEAQGLAGSEAQSGQKLGHVTRGIELCGQVGGQGAGSNRITLQIAQSDDRPELGGLIPRQSGSEGQPRIERLGAGLARDGRRPGRIRAGGRQSGHHCLSSSGRSGARGPSGAARQSRPRLRRA